MEVGVEVSELIGEDVGVRNDVETVFAELLLHFDNIFAKAVFPGELARAGKVVDFLVLVEVVVDVLLLRLTGPEDVPVVALCLAEAVRLEH